MQNFFPAIVLVFGAVFFLGALATIMGKLMKPAAAARPVLAMAAAAPAEAPRAGAATPPAPPAAPVPTVAAPNHAPARVRIIDIDVPFWSLVWFLVKLVFALLPAAVIIGMMWGVFMLITGSVLGPFSR